MYLFRIPSSRMSTRNTSAWRVLKIESVKVKYSKANGFETWFMVLWHNWKKSDKWRTTLENLVQCPDLVKKFNDKRRDDNRLRMIRKGVPVATLPNHWTIPPLSEAIVKKFKKPFEFIPDGTEYPRSIYNSFVDEGVTFFSVRLKYVDPEVEYVTIRKEVMEYYYPTYMIMYYEKKRRNEAKS